MRRAGNMMLSKIRVLALALAALVPSCVATPLPTPPSAHPQRMTLSASMAAVDLRGGPGALEGVASLRVSSARRWVVAPVMADGSFEVLGLSTAPIDVLYLEAVADEDVFLVALRADGAGGVFPYDPGDDADADGSPDRIDCAPSDPAQQGRECAFMCEAELCDGRDDDCDGSIDEGCVDADMDGFTAPADCNDMSASIFPGAMDDCGDLVDGDCDGEIDEGCPRSCVSDMDCPVTQLCDGGTCLCPSSMGLLVCGETCVFPEVDPEHCGGCDVACAMGQSCVGGMCTP